MPPDHPVCDTGDFGDERWDRISRIVERGIGVNEIGKPFPLRNIHQGHGAFNDTTGVRIKTCGFKIEKSNLLDHERRVYSPLALRAINLYCSNCASAAV